VARLGEKALPFYALMKKSDKKCKWTEEADKAFAHLKQVLSTPLVLVAPEEKGLYYSTPSPLIRW
jgi:hypothetical protein